MEIKYIDSKDDKSNIVLDVLSDLPEWFGLPDSTQAYIDESRELPLFAAVEDHEVIEFMTLKETSEFTVEIHCMGVKKEYHRTGVGKSLLNFALENIDKKYKLMHVKTVAMGNYDEYDRTNRFYHSLGFMDLEIFPDMWDPCNPCLILIKPL